MPSLVTPKPERKYDGLEFRLNKRFTNNWSATASYLYSRLYGNYSGLASSDENGRTAPNVNRYYDNTIMSYDANGQAVYGPLQTDRPHNFKLNGVYDFKWGTTLGANWFIAERHPAVDGVPLQRLPGVPERPQRPRPHARCSRSST